MKDNEKSSAIMSAEEYIQGVQDGSILVCKYVKLAVKRHLKDLKTGKKRGLKFDPVEGDRGVRFFSYLKHSKGRKFAGKTFELAGWEAFIVYMLYGWKNSKGTRRFRTSYTEVAKKNGKSTLAAGVGLEMLIGEKEPGAEVYSAATSRDQAKIVFNEARNMVKMSPNLTRMIRNHQNNMVCDYNMGKFEPLSSDYNTLEGKNPYCAIIDEFHAHKDDLLFSNLQTATVSRDQSLIWVITTAGYEIGGPCYRYRKICIDLLEGKIQDDSLFAIIFTLDENDDWKDPKNWVKSNPNLGVSVELDALMNGFQGAMNESTKEVAFKTKNLNIWVGSAKTWIPDEKWMKCAGDDCEPPPEVSVYGGLDLSATGDLTCFGILWEIDGILNWKPVFFMPNLSLMEKMKRDNVNYYEWIRDGYVVEIDGDTVDYKVVYDKIMEMAGKYKIVDIGYDPYNATQLVIQLQDEGLQMSAYPQRVSHMNVPCKHLEKIVKDKTLNHMGNPVMRWMNGNAWVKPDANDNIMINKGKSSARVDGMVCLAMAIGGYLTFKPETSIYEERGFITIGE